MASAVAEGLCVQGSVYKGRELSIHDGGRLCSPGRWVIEDKRYSSSAAFGKVRLHIRPEFLKWVQGTDAQKQFWQLALGKCVSSSSPFPRKFLQKRQQDLGNLFVELGPHPGRRPWDRKTEINFCRLRSLLSLADIPDAAFLNDVRSLRGQVGCLYSFAPNACDFRREI